MKSKVKSFIAIAVGVLIGAFLLLFAVGIVSIAIEELPDNLQTNSGVVTKKTQRIIGKESTVYKGVGYQIIEVDGIEYLSCSSGGICPLVKTNPQ